MLVYVPALLSGMEFQIKKAQQSDDYLWRGYDGGWFTDRSILQHEHVLTSYYYSNRVKDYKKTVGMHDRATLWADSGGFSLATQGVEINPETVIKWQNDNADIAFTLDFPPVEMTGGTKTSAGTFEYISLDRLRENAIKTAKNGEVFAKLKRKDLIMYNVIHGNRLSYMEEWWKYNGHFDFEGYATGSKPAGDALYQAFNIAFLHSKGVRSRIHLLGISGIRVIPALAYMAKDIDMISYDSTSYGRGALNRAYVFPDKMWDHFNFGAVYVKGSYELKCDCEVCAVVRDADIYAEPGTWPGMLCALHNLKMLKQWTAQLNSIVHDKEKFRANVEQMSAQKYERSMTAKGVEFWDFYMKHGLEEAYVKFFPDKNQDEHSRKVLF